MHEPHLKAMAAMLRRCQPRHDLYTVFGDCMEAMAISIANSVDHKQHETREARYLAIVCRYNRDIVETFPHGPAELVRALEVGRAMSWGCCSMISDCITRRWDNISHPTPSADAWRR